MRKVLHILGDFNDEDIEWIIDIGFKKTIHPQEFLIQANHKLNEIYFVLAGRVDIELPDGSLFGKIKSGEILGEMSFIEDEKPIVNAKVIEKTDVISITHESIIDRFEVCLLYTSDAADDSLRVDLGGRRIIKKRIPLSMPSATTPTHADHVAAQEAAFFSSRRRHTR